MNLIKTTNHDKYSVLLIVSKLERKEKILNIWLYLQIYNLQLALEKSSIYFSNTISMAYIRVIDIYRYGNT